MNYIPKNTDNIIDSRDVIRRVSDLEGELSDLEGALEEAKQALTDAGTNPDGVLQRAARDAEMALNNWEDADELKALRELAKEAADYAGDWEDGATLIRNSYFKQYAQEFADDIGAVPKRVTWPCSCIDWDEAAYELKQDYTLVRFDGVDYWVR